MSARGAGRRLRASLQVAFPIFGKPWALCGCAFSTNPSIMRWGRIITRSTGSLPRDEAVQMAIVPGVAGFPDEGEEGGTFGPARAGFFDVPFLEAPL